MKARNKNYKQQKKKKLQIKNVELKKIVKYQT